MGSKAADGSQVVTIKRLDNWPHRHIQTDEHSFSLEQRKQKSTLKKLYFMHDLVATGQ